MIPLMICLTILIMNKYDFIPIKEMYNIDPIAFPNCPKDRCVLNEEVYLWMKI